MNVECNFVLNQKKICLQGQKGGTLGLSKTFHAFEFTGNSLKLISAKF